VRTTAVHVSLAVGLVSQLNQYVIVNTGLAYNMQLSDTIFHK